MLKIENVDLVYRNGVRALHGVSIDSGPGVFGLLGPNGAGKSSLMRVLATLQKPDTGCVRLDNTDVLAEPDKVREMLGYLPQDFMVYPELSAQALLAHVVALKLNVNRGERDDWVELLLCNTNLWSDRTRKVGEFSGGMRQRLGIAQALIGKPKLIIVDEPTSGLDPEERMRVLDLLAEAGEQSIVLLSTHIVEDVASICSQMAVMSKGKILAQIRPAEGLRDLSSVVWEATFERAVAAQESRRFRTLTSRLANGKVKLAVEAPEKPGPEFERIEPNLAHLYFHILNKAPTSGASGSDAHCSVM